MSTQAGVGISKNPNSKEAGAEACKMAMQKVKNPGMVIVFSSVKHNQEDMLSGVREISGETPLAGCSSAGEITAEGPGEGCVAAMAIESDSINFSVGKGGEIKSGAREAGAELAKNIKSNAGKEINCLIMLTDVLNGNGADVVRGVQDVVGKDFLVMGGAAGDDFLFKQTFEYYNGEAIPSSITGVGLSGNYSIGVGVRHGWIPIGMPMKVTKSNGAVLEELDGKPAISVYEDYFGKKTEELREEPLARMAITYPLGMSVNDSKELLIRDPITIDEKGAITCAAEIPIGSEIRLMIGNKEEAIMAAKEAAKQALRGLGGKKPKAIIVFDCIARRKLFGRHAGEEIEAIQSVLGKEAPLIGFYTYGEIAPLAKDGDKYYRSSFHNETAVILALGD